MDASRRAALEILRQEAHRYIEYQFTTVRDLEEKAGLILRFDALLGGVLVGAVSLLVDNVSVRLDLVSTIAITVSLASLLVSLLLSALALHRSNIAVGIQGRDLIRTVNYELDPLEVLEAAVPAYGMGILRNEREVIRPRSLLVMASLAFLAISACSLVLVATRLTWGTLLV